MNDPLSVTLAGYENLSGFGSILFNMGRAFQEKKILNRLICLAFKKSGLNQDQIKNEPRYLRSIHRGIDFLKNRFLPEFPARYINEVLFDWFSQSFIPKSSNTLLCSDSGLIRSIRKGRKLGQFTVVQQRTAHQEQMYRILIEEEKKFGIREDTIYIHRPWVENRNKSLIEADRIISISNLVTESCVAEGIPKQKIRTVSVGVGVDSEYFFPKKYGEKKFRCLFVGHKSFINGIPYLLEAWDTLGNIRADLTICGMHNKELLQYYHKKTDFISPGRVTPLSFYQNASIFVFPSLINAFPKVVLEAMSCGLPVIISEGVGTKDIIRDGKEGFIVPIRDSKAIKEKILYFYDNPSEIKRMGKLARKKAVKCTWKKYIDEICNFLN